MQSPTFDLSKYPTVDTIRLLASLLERMTAANDQINRAACARKDNVRRASSASLLGSSPVQGVPGGMVTAAAAAAAAAANIPPPPPPPPNADAYTRFHARSIPSIDIYSYLSRILKYCPCTNECFLSLLVYFDRMAKNSLALAGKPFTIDSYNIHRLIIAGVMVSSKFFSDVFYTNTRYAKVGGLPVSELNSLELEFLVLNNFNLSVPISELQRYGDQLVKVGYMEKEILKSIMYDAPSYTNPGAIRHARSSSLGSGMMTRYNSDPAAAAAAIAVATATGERGSYYNNGNGGAGNNNQPAAATTTAAATAISTDQLCDLTASVSLEDPNVRRSFYAQPAYLHKIPSNNSLRSSNVRRMNSFGNLHLSQQQQQQQQHSPQALVYNTPISNQDSPMTLAGDEEDRRLAHFGPTGSYRLSSSPDRRSNRHSFISTAGGNDIWRQQSPSSSSPQQQHHYVRQRQGSLGFNRSDSPDGWPLQQQQQQQQQQQYQQAFYHQHHRQPRQSRSSVNLYQQGGFHKSSNPALVNSFTVGNGSSSSLLSNSSSIVDGMGGYGMPAAADSSHSVSSVPMAAIAGYYAYGHHPIGIPTPPPSSSPVHPKHHHNSPYQSSSQSIMYL